MKFVCASKHVNVKQHASECMKCLRMHEMPQNA